MKKTLLVLLFSIFMFSSCNTENGGYGGSPYSETICQGTIRFVNNSSNPYTVSVSGYSSFVLGGKKWIEKKYDKGSYVINVKQNSGYLFYPTEETYTIRLGCGGEGTCSFPGSGPFKAEE